MRKIDIAKAVDKTRGQALKTYGSRNSRKIAEETLTFCEEWAIINLDSVDAMSQRGAKTDCKKYVKNALKNDEVVGSILIMIITGIIVRLIVDWIVNNFIYNLKK